MGSKERRYYFVTLRYVDSVHGLHYVPTHTDALQNCNQRVFTFLYSALFLFHVSIFPGVMEFCTHIINDCDVSSNGCVGLYSSLYPQTFK